MANKVFSPYCSPLFFRLILVSFFFSSIKLIQSRGLSQSANENEARVNELLKIWEHHYGLNSKIPVLVSSPYPFDTGVPMPTHLQDCFQLTNENVALEERNPNGKIPSWAIISNYTEIAVPWVQGGKDDNLPLTRLTQRDIWLSQHPPNCNSEQVKFLIYRFPEEHKNDFAKQVHALSIALSISYALKRVLVLFSPFKDYDAKEECLTTNYDHLYCYFFPLTSKACEMEAMELWKVKEKNLNMEKYLKTYDEDGNTYSQLSPFAKIEKRLEKEKDRVSLLFEKMETFTDFGETIQPWGEYAWKQNTEVEVMAKDFVMTDQMKKSIWLSSQMTRYILRWPTLRLCHLINIERHNVYGRVIAIKVIEASDRQEKIPVVDAIRVFENFKNISARGDILERTTWIKSDPFIFRPIVSIQIHPHAGNLWNLKSMSLKTHMFLAERIRFQFPNLRYVWLSTATQAVVDESVYFPHWSFLYSDIPRLRVASFFSPASKEVSWKEKTESSIVNLIMSSQCDFFVGAMSDGYNRLINELRLTNGRLRSGYFATDFSEW